MAAFKDHFSTTWRLDDLLGYVDTWSAVKAAEKALGHSPVAAFRQELTESWGNPATPRRVRWPLTMRVGRVS